MNRHDQNLQTIVLVAILILLPIILLALRYRHRLFPQAEFPQVQVTIEPNAVAKEVGESFTVKVNLSATQSISGINAVFSFDPSILEVESVTSDTSSFTDDLSVLTSATDGKVSLSAVTRKSLVQLPNGGFTAGEIKFKGKAIGTSNISLDSTTQIVGPSVPGGSEQATVFEPILLQEPSVTISENLRNSPQLSFSTHFNGITNQFTPIPVKVTLVDSTSGTKKEYTVTLTSHTPGIYDINGWLVLRGLPAGKQYDILVKGPKHLQRHMASNQLLSTGQKSTNRFDWTGTPLLPGDLPNPKNGGKQDGVINALDISLILERIDKRDAASTTVADLNYDRVVNLNDFALLIATLKTENTDEP